MPPNGSPPPPPIEGPWPVLELKLRVVGMPFPTVVKIELRPDTIIEGYEILVNGDPVVSETFALHAPGERYHTICSLRFPEEISQVHL